MLCFLEWIFSKCTLYQTSFMNKGIWSNLSKMLEFLRKQLLVISCLHFNIEICIGDQHQLSQDIKMLSAIQSGDKLAVWHNI